MRVENLKGIYLKYADSGEPVESVGKTNYIFNRHNDRTCLVSDWQHMRILLERRAFIPVGVEVEEVAPQLVQTVGESAGLDVTINGTVPETTTSTIVSEPAIKHVQEPKRGPGRPRKFPRRD